MATASAHGWTFALRRTAPSLLLVCSVLGLSMFGLIVLYSASRYQGTPFVAKQAVWLGFAFVAGLTAYALDWNRVRRLAWPVAAGAFVLLASVLVFGREVNGAQRWLGLGPMNLQVSDPAKIALVFVLAHYLSQNQRHLKTFWLGFAAPMALVCGMAGMIFLQPDYGTAALTGFVGVVLMFLAGTRLMYLIPAGLTAVTLFSVAVTLDPVRLKRITSFLDLEANKADGAYQLWQGILAYGSGGLHGVGLGNGRQQMAFLPESHTDFIFPVIGEELGFFFTSGVVLVFLAVFVVVFIKLRSAPNMYQFTLCTGALLFIVMQALINFGVATGLLPTKGMSLPFISYGGSNLVAMFMLSGIVLRCFREWDRPPLRRALEI